jgi:hypothetical protein
MFNGDGMKILFYSKPVDMRNSIDGLSMMAAQHLCSEAKSGIFYVFYNKKKDKLKVLYWERNGFCLWFKRLEKERFKIPEMSETGVELTIQQLRWILDGLDYTKLQGHKELKYSIYY